MVDAKRSNASYNRLWDNVRTVVRSSYADLEHSRVDFHVQECMIGEQSDEAEVARFLWRRFVLSLAHNC